MAGLGRRRGDDPALLREYQEDDRLSAAANEGDRSAAGAFLERNQRLLATTARRLAAGAVEPDDLLSDALVNLLTLWKSGTGPMEKASAYVIRSMRNRMIDEFRSPRSRVLPLVDAEDHLPTVTQDTRHIDLGREYTRVRQALLLLPADQQHVLRATIIDGRKPAELEEELDRSASSIYALSLRARRALRRAMLRVMLEEDAPPEECRHAATRLPPVIAADVDETGDAPGMDHIRGCRRCRRVWGRFASTASLLGVVTCLLVGGVVFTPTSAQAAEHPSSEPRGQTVAPPRTRGAARGKGAGRAGAGWSLGTLVWSALPFVAIASGLAILAFAVLPPLLAEPEAEGGVAGDSDLVVTSQVLEPGRASLDISLTGRGDTSTVTLLLPAGVTVASTPDGWDCQTTDAELDCAIDGPPHGVIELIDSRAEQAGDYRLTVSATVGEQTVTGTAWGQIADDVQTVRASID